MKDAIENRVGLKVGAPLLMLLSVQGCTAETDSDITWGDPVVCEEPRDGIGAYSETAPDRGLVEASRALPEQGCIPISGHVLAEDLDDDGDPDLIFYEPDGMPRVHRNDGVRFTAMPRASESPVPGRTVLGMGLVDLDEDRLIDLVLTGEGFVVTLKNLGRLSFDTPEIVLMDEAYPRGCYHSVAAGDMDGDGRLDLYVPGLDRIDGPEGTWSAAPTEGAGDHLFLRTDDGFEDRSDLLVSDGNPAVLLGLFTDRDGDGDLDLLVPPDRPYVNLLPMAFYRSDGGVLTDDASDIHADLLLSGMGIASADFNQDGRLDYCLTDASTATPCLVSFGADEYVESGLALGFVIEAEPLDKFDETVWEGWSIEIMDLDNDGDLDAVASAGLPQEGDWPRRDALWEGRDGAFSEVGLEVGFDIERENHYGLVAADFDGDGARDLVAGTRSGPPRFWDRPCTSGGWLEIELVGPRGNPRGIGSRVETKLGPRTEVQEVYGPRGWGQSPAKVHIGLGSEPVLTTLVVTWPDGTVATAVDVPANREVVVRHPDAPP